MKRQYYLTDFQTLNSDFRLFQNIKTHLNEGVIQRGVEGIQHQQNGLKVVATQMVVGEGKHQWSGDGQSHRER